MIRKKYLFTFMALMSISCSGINKNIKYTNENTQYRLKQVYVGLIAKCPNDKFPNQEQLTKIFTKRIKDDFCSKMNCTDDENLTENVVDLDIEIMYKRVFVGEFFGCTGGYGNSTVTFKNKALMDNNIIAEYNSDGEMVHDRGVAGNLSLISRQLTLTGDAKVEEKTLNAISFHISNEMIRRLK